MRQLPPLNALRAFEAAARHRSFKKAAEELLVTPTAISHQIRLLEEICGCPLFRRHPRPITLTREGAGLFPVLSQGFDSFAAAVEKLKGNKDRPLVIATTTAFAVYWLMPRLRLWRQISDVELEVRASETPVDLHDGEVDVAIRYALRPPGGVEVVKLCEDHFLPVISPTLLNGQACAAEEINRFTLIDFRSKMPNHADHVTWQKWLEAATGNRDKAKAVLGEAKFIRFSEGSHTIEAAIAGEGIALSSGLLAHKALSQGQLVAPFETTLPGMNDYALYLEANPRLELIQAFVGWIRDEMVDDADDPG
ncbi:LysR family transcriptional regulator [Aestuariispira insulae]|uniref:LysR family transcriptional regulator n=2 Tax=Aestuariispira insulae TaxID=1461337 RepID=A0A3D9HV47_9PROT|nr:LysR family transcriptional regulator [Aestuariispira insulae]